ILNAAIRATDNTQRSEEGFQLTFATNHLAHYLLARLLWPVMATDGRVVITTSDTHDPAIVPFGPKTLNQQELAYPNENSPKGMDRKSTHLNSSHVKTPYAVIRL